MKKKKIIIAIVVCIIAILAVIVCAHEVNISKNEDVQQENIVNESIEENVIVENEIQEENIIVDDPVIEEDSPSTDKMESSVATPSNTVYQSDTVYESNSGVGTTDKKEEAINLVKQEWGEDDTVSFSCDSVTTQGEYIIAVTSLETATVRNYFRVNLENKTVTVEF